MARATKLKVYRTVAGFVDAYVAAPSKKAALAAWGSDKNLFARGLAEIVTDPALAAEPLASPGHIVRRSRGTAAEQMAALPKEARRRAPARPARTAPEREPKPDSAAVDDAEAALEQAEADAHATAKDFDAREAALARERHAAEREHRDRVRAAQAARDDRRADYDAAMARWRNPSSQE